MDLLEFSYQMSLALAQIVRPRDSFLYSAGSIDKNILKIRMHSYCTPYMPSCPVFSRNILSALTPIDTFLDIEHSLFLLLWEVKIMGI